VSLWLTAAPAPEEKRQQKAGSRERRRKPLFMTALADRKARVKTVNTNRVSTGTW